MKDWRLFIKAGHAIFTLENTKTGGRFTYKVTRAKQYTDVWYVSVLNGPNNERDYLYIGSIRRTTFGLTPASRVTGNAKSFRVFEWLNRIANMGTDLPPNVKIWHANRCGRCGRALTVPESVEWGFGPECIITVMGAAPGNHIPLETAKQVRKLMRLQAQIEKEETDVDN